jgi:hypothetical protein
MNNGGIADGDEIFTDPAKVLAGLTFDILFYDGY